jgi:hypothetical protein
MLYSSVERFRAPTVRGVDGRYGRAACLVPATPGPRLRGLATESNSALVSRFRQGTTCKNAHDSALSSGRDPPVRLKALAAHVRTNDIDVVAVSSHRRNQVMRSEPPRVRRTRSPKRGAPGQHALSLDTRVRLGSDSLNGAPKGDAALESPTLADARGSVAAAVFAWRTRETRGWHFQYTRHRSIWLETKAARQSSLFEVGKP